MAPPPDLGDSVASRWYPFAIRIRRTSMSGSKIFISYRRGLDNDSAGRLYDRMAHVFGEDRVFRDVDASTDMLGLDFHRVLNDRVSDCAAFVAVIGRGWIDQIERLQSPDDFVRIEIETAVGRDDVRVVPVLIGDTQMPDPSALPESLHPLTRRGGLKLQNEGYAASVGTLIDVLQRTLRSDTGDSRDAIDDAPRPPPDDPAPVAVKPRLEAEGAASASAGASAESGGSAPFRSEPVGEAVPSAARAPNEPAEVREAQEPAPAASERIRQSPSTAPEPAAAAPGQRLGRLVNLANAAAAIGVAVLCVVTIVAGAGISQRVGETVSRLDDLHPSGPVQIARGGPFNTPSPPPPAPEPAD